MNPFKNLCNCIPLFFLLFVATLTATKNKNISFCGCKKSKPFSRESIVKFAHKNRDDLEAFTYAKKASVADQRTAVAAYLPQASLGLQVTRTAPSSIVDPKTSEIQICPETTTSVNPTFGFSQLLLSGGEPILDYRIAKKQTQIITAQEKNAYNIIQFNAESSFLNTQKLLLEEQAIQTKDNTSKMVFEQNSVQKEVGFLNNAQWLQAAATYAKEQSDVSNYEHNIQNSLATLQRQTNSNIQLKDISLNTRKTACIRLKPLSYYLDAAQAHRPDLEVQKYLVKQAKLQEKKYRQRYVPTMSFFAQAYDLKYENEYRSAYWNIGLDFSWNFDGLASAHASISAEQHAIEYTLQKKDLEIRIVQEVKNLYYSLKNFINNFRVSKFQLEEKRGLFEKRKKEHRVGLISSADLARARLEYEQAAFNFTALKIDIRKTYQNLLFVCGYPNKKRNDPRIVT